MQAEKQQGMTFISLVIVLAFIGMVVLSILKVFPIYMEHFSVQKSIETMERTPDLKRMSVTQIRSLFEKKLDVNGVTSVKAKDAKIGRGTGELTFILAYEVRKDYFANIDIVLSFEDEFIIELN